MVFFINHLNEIVSYPFILTRLFQNFHILIRILMKIYRIEIIQAYKLKLVTVTISDNTRNL